MMDFFSEADYSGLPPEIVSFIKTGNFNRTQITYLKKIPWGNTATPEIDIGYAKETLDTSHYGMQPVKDQILRYGYIQEILMK